MLCSECFTEVTDRPIHRNGITNTMHPYLLVTNTSRTDTPIFTYKVNRHTLCMLMVRTRSE